MSESVLGHYHDVTIPDFKTWVPQEYGASPSA
jgi:hypothetical protein